VIVVRNKLRYQGRADMLCPTSNRRFVPISDIGQLTPIQFRSTATNKCKEQNYRGPICCRLSPIDAAGKRGRFGSTLWKTNRMS
jgi:hypothetical protein